MALYNSYQEIFDKVVEHARGMAKKCSRGAVCYYRHPDNPNYKCFVGALIPDDIYDAKMENKTVGQLFEKIEHLFNKQIVDGDLLIFLTHLQQLHDYKNTNQWVEQFEYLASVYNLVYER